MIDLEPRPYLILGTSTDVGKTFFVSEICKKFRQNNIAINAIKPVASGFLDDDLQSDTAKILQNLGRDFSSQNINETTPFRLKGAFSPLKAAKMEGKMLNFDEILSFCQEKIAQNQGKTFLIEGAGGVMTPINDEKTFLDLAKDLKIPVILIGSVFLGAISNILCAIEALKSRKIDIKAIIINDFGNKNPDLSENDIICEVEKLSKIGCFSIKEIISSKIT